MMQDSIDFDFTGFLDGDSTTLEFNIGDFDLVDDTIGNNRYSKPKMPARPTMIKYNNAQKLAKNIVLTKGAQVHAIVSGDFIFGDFIEALLVEKNAVASECYISTLSLSQNNADSLGGLLDDGRIQKLTMILSNYFYSHERKTLWPYLMQQIDKDDKTDVLVVRSHTKIVLMHIDSYYIVMSGSANLRSSNSIEQFVLQDDQELYEFYREWFESKRERYSIIKRGTK